MTDFEKAFSEWHREYFINENQVPEPIHAARWARGWEAGKHIECAVSLAEMTDRSIKLRAENARLGKALEYYAYERKVYSITGELNRNVAKQALARPDDKQKDET